MERSNSRNPTSSPTFLAVAAAIDDEHGLAVLKGMQLLQNLFLKLGLAICFWYVKFFDKRVVQTDKERFQAPGVLAKVVKMVPSGPV